MGCGTFRQERACKHELKGCLLETPAMSNPLAKAFQSCELTMARASVCYRVYFKQRGPELIELLAGGDKSSQAKDIKIALRLARNLN
jgi:hypothetical protein